MRRAPSWTTLIVALLAFLMMAGVSAYQDYVLRPLLDALEWLMRGMQPPAF